MKDTIIYTILFLAFMTGVKSQSVEYFIDKAKRENPGLEALRLEYEAAKEKPGQVDDFPDPKVSLGVGVFPVETRLGSQSLKIGITQSIPWPGLLKAKRNAAMAGAKILSSKDEIKTVDIEYSIRKTYAHLVYLHEKKKILDKKINVLKGLIELSKSGVRAGKGRLSNALLVQRRMEAVRADLSLIDNEKARYEVELNRWARRPLDTEVVIDTGFTFDDDIEVNVINHPGFMYLEDKISASKAISEMTAYQVKPKIGIGIDYSLITSRNDADPLHNGRDVLMPMASVSIPLNTGRFESIKQEQILRQDAIRAQMSDIEEAFSAEIARAKADIKWQKNIIKKNTDLKEITRKTIELMQGEYAAEGTRFEELLRQSLDLIDFDLSILLSRYKIALDEALLFKYGQKEK